MKFIVSLEDKLIRHEDSGIQFKVAQEYTGNQFEVTYDRKTIDKIPAEWWTKPHVISHLLTRAMEAYSLAWNLQREREAFQKRNKDKLVFYH